MKIKIGEITLTNIFELSQFIKDNCKGFSSLEETAQELINIFYQTFITDSGNSTFALSRFFKSCTYDELPEDLKIYIQYQEGKEKIPPQNKYLTLLGTSGELNEWKCRRDSKGHQALPLYDSFIVDELPMLSALFSQIGFTIVDTGKTDKEIILNKEDHDFGIFCVEKAGGSTLIPKQTEFVEPFGIKSVLGFGGYYKTDHIYAVIIFSKVEISKETAKLFLSLNPAIKSITLRHEMTGKIFKSENN
jgi:hypothetical protein